MKTLQRFAFILVLLTLNTATVRGAENDAAKKDIAQLQGEWTMISGTADGQPMPEAMLRGARRVCKDDVTTVMVGGELFMKARFILNPSKNPKTIDYQVIDGPTKGKTQLGIYQIDRDRVKFCFGGVGAERPQEFSTKPGDGRTSSVWKRTAKGPNEPK